jgi:hypothetical protein
MELEHRVHGVPFDSSVVRVELPLNTLGVVVSISRPRGDLFANFLQTADASAQTLFRQNTQFTFIHFPQYLTNCHAPVYK